MPGPHWARLAAAAVGLFAAGYVAFHYWGVPGTVVLALVVAVSGWGLSRVVRP
jgi:hypothetical protein